MEVWTVENRGPVLLVIEDAGDQAILVGIAARRAHPGLDVRLASNGLEGIAYLAGEAPFEERSQHPLPDLIILDLFMPEMDGFGVLGWIEALPVGLGIPVVVLTSSQNPQDEARARELGAASVYAKPTELVGLGTVVREIVEKWIGRSAIIGAHMFGEG